MNAYDCLWNRAKHALKIFKTHESMSVYDGICMYMSIFLNPFYREWSADRTFPYGFFRVNLMWGPYGSVRNFIPDLRGQLMDLFTIAWG